MSIEDYSGIRSTLIDEGTPPPSGNVSKNSIFLFGVSSKGPVGQPIWVGTRNVEEMFGPVPLDTSFDMSLVRGYYEIAQSSKNVPDIALVRVGTTAPAAISLYETQYISSGDNSFSLDDEGLPYESMNIQAVSEGTELNGSRITVTTPDDSDFPSYMRVELTDGSIAGFNLARYKGAPGTYSKVSDLVNAINSHTQLAGKIVADFTPISQEVTVTITASGEVTNTEYDLVAPDGVTNETSNVSYGDKLFSIESAWVVRDVSEEIAVGSLTYDLTVEPQKDLDGNDTITTFIRQSARETLLTVTSANAGATGVEKALYCTKVTGWDSSYAISGSVTHDWEFEQYVKRNGTTTFTLLDNDKYTLNTTTGKVTILETLSLGDVYYSTYRYEVTYTEAKLRSELVLGDDRSYFIYGGTIVFGAEQPSLVYAYYTANEFLDSGDIAIVDKDNAVIEFTNVSILPAVGETVTITINYEPELPAASGTIFTQGGGIIQPGSIAGGKDGRMVSKKDYLKALKTAMQSVDIYPRRSMVVMGMWLDETISGFNEETGMAELVPLNMISSLLPYVERSSKYTNECEINLPPLPPSDLTQSGQNAWIDRLITTSSTDYTRAANLIDGINNFRVQAPTGALLGSHPSVNNGRQYMFNPACVYAAYKSELPYNESAMKGYIPGNIQNLGVKIFNADTIGSINAKRYTAVTINTKGQFIWEDSPTLALRNRSVYDRQFVRDTVYLAVSMARDAAEKYIGKPRKNEYIMAMKKDIGKALELLVPDVLSDIFIKVIPVSDGYITGKTKIKMILETVKETRIIEIETVASLSASA
jgi:hypothetical protein